MDVDRYLSFQLVCENDSISNIVYPTHASVVSLKNITNNLETHDTGLCSTNLSLTCLVFVLSSFVLVEKVGKYFTHFCVYGGGTWGRGVTQGGGLGGLVANRLRLK